MSFNSTSSSSNHNIQLPSITNHIDERDRFFKFKKIHQKNFYISDLHNILKEYLNLTSSIPNRPSEDWRAHIILENFQNRALTTWPLEKIKMGFIAAVNDDDVSLLSVLLQIAKIRKINMNTVFANIPDAEYEVKGKNFKLNFLHLAVHKQKHSALQYMLESNLFDVNFKTCKLSLLKKYDNTPLHIAIENLDAIAIKLLLSTTGIKPTICNIENYTPFDVLLEDNKENTNSLECIEIFRNVLSENAFLKMVDGFTLIAASEGGFNEFSKYLIPRLSSIDINYQSDSYGITPLFNAVLNFTEPSVVQAFLSHKDIDVNMRTLHESSKITPLHLAIKINNMHAFTLLVTHPKTEVNKPEGYYSDYKLRIDGTPLVSAVRLNNLKAVKLLLKHKADLLAKSYKIVDVCAHCGKITCGDYISTFQMAQQNKNPEIFKLLYEKAQQNNNPEILKLLHEAKEKKQ